MTSAPSSTEADALAAFEGRARIDAAIAVEGRRIVFPPRAAWLTVALERPAGAYRVTIDLAAPSALRLELASAEGFVPIPVERNGVQVTSVFASAAPLTLLRLMAVEAGPIEVVRCLVEAISPWRSLLPDWPIGSVRIPPRPPSALPAFTAATFAPPASWDRRVRALEAEAVTLDGERLRVGQTGVVRLVLDPPLARGWHRVEAVIETGSGAPALVEPRVLRPHATSPLDTACILRPGRGGPHHAGDLWLSRPTVALLLRPREQRGEVVLRDLAISRATPLDAVGRLLRLAGPAAARAARAALAGARTRSGQRAAGRHSAASGAAAAAPAAAMPVVSVVVATRDAPKHLARFLATFADTAYAPLELVLVDNGTRDGAARTLLAEAAESGRARVVLDDRPFNFAALNNLGARTARGDVLVFANNDLEFVQPRWLHELVAEAIRPEIGVAGARLLYPDGRVQHAGLVLAGEARVRHAERFLAASRPGHQQRQQRTTPVAAVTGALMALRREVFCALGGFDGEAFPVLYNDVDLCLRARRHGLCNVLVPAAMAVHHESASIGQRPGASLFARGGPVWRWGRAVEADRFRQRWSDDLDADPCYPPDLDALAADFRTRR